MPPVGFETEIPASERPQTHALECMAAVVTFTFNKYDRSILAAFVRESLIIYVEVETVRLNEEMNLQANGICIWICT